MASTSTISASEEEEPFPALHGHDVAGINGISPKRIVLRGDVLEMVIVFKCDNASQ